ncbi:MAG: serpin family protein [Sandaracinaceae bacterium]
MRLPITLALLLSACGSQETAIDPTPVEAPVDTAPTEESTVQDESEETPATAPAEPSAVFAASTRAFGADLYRRLRSREGNLVVSPGSIDIAFAMTFAGARGETAAQMARVFHFGQDGDALHAAAQAQLARWNDPDRDTYELRVANRIFAKQGMDIQPDFAAITRERYGAPMELISFSPPEAARAHINRWVAEQTRERIDELLPSGALDATTRMVLTNAVYFLGNWKTQFPEDATREEPFYVNGEGVPARTMHLTHSFGFAHRDGAQLLEMPYVGDALSMVIVLPDAQDGLPALEEGLTAEQLAQWTSDLEEQPVTVSLPRFRLEMDEPLELKETLRAMGMPLPFQADADFSGMSAPSDPDERLSIDEAYHMAFIEVTEAGTEAAAATAVVMGRGAGPAAAPPTRFTADHPFLFLIRDTQTGSILFMGRVNDPRP